MASEADTLERWFAIADVNRDGRIEGTEAITFFQRSGLSREALKEVRRFKEFSNFFFDGTVGFRFGVGRLDRPRL